MSDLQFIPSKKKSKKKKKKKKSNQQDISDQVFQQKLDEQSSTNPSSQRKKRKRDETFKPDTQSENKIIPELNQRKPRYNEGGGGYFDKSNRGIGRGRGRGSERGRGRGQGRGGNNSSNISRMIGDKTLDPLLEVLQSKAEKYQENNDNDKNAIEFYDEIIKHEELIPEEIDNNSSENDNEMKLKMEIDNNEKKEIKLKTKLKDSLFGLKLKEYNKYKEINNKLFMNDNNYYIFQFPPVLPLKVDDEYIKNPRLYTNKLNMAGSFNLSTMANGKIGKLIKYKSGKIVLKIGDKKNGYFKLNLDKCAPIACYQELLGLKLSNNQNSGNYNVFGKINNEDCYVASCDPVHLFK